MSKQLNRKVLKVNNRTEVTTGFVYTPDRGYKSVAEPSIVTWNGPGKGVQGESVNSGIIETLRVTFSIPRGILEKTALIRSTKCHTI